MNKYMVFSFAFFNAALAMDNKSFKTQLAVICTPYADVMLQLKPNTDNNPHDPNQDTQALYYEPVTILQQCPGWYKVATPEQMKVETKKDINIRIPHEGWIEEKYLIMQESYSENDASFPIIVQSPIATVAISDQEKDKSKIITVLAGTKLYAQPLSDNETNYKVSLVNGDMKRHCSGYINKENVCPSKKLNNLSTSDKRALLLKHAQKFLNTLYFWGGLTKDGIDCSGLTYLCYRMVGKSIPRDAKDQYIEAKSCAPKNLEQGDLLFLSGTNDPEKRIRHVMLYDGNDQIIDAAGTDSFGTRWEKVRTITGQQWLGKPFTQMEQAEVVGPYVVYGGTYLP